MNRIFKRADILLPQNVDMSKWSVIACDQFTSQTEYWEALEKLTEGVPSTMHLMLPEAFLEHREKFPTAPELNAAMAQYLERGVFRTLPDSYIYVERTLRSGAVRRGLVGVLDLEAYDYAKDSTSPVRATEGTVESRLPARVEVRRGAPIEMPHIMVFIDDASDSVMGSLTAKKKALNSVYDFELNANGGHIRGWRVSGADADAVDELLDGLADPAALKEKYGDAAPAVYAMGDGNHSLATAKKCWEEIRPTLTAAQRETHPARYSMVELVNIHDEAITFEPIHKVVFATDTSTFIAEAEAWFDRGVAGEASHEITLCTAEGSKRLTVRGLSIGQLIGTAEQFCQNYIAAHGGYVDYIHNDDTALSMGREAGNAAILLPKMEKAELFPSVIRTGPFPKKSFSIGHAEDKRYYLECRKIR